MLDAEALVREIDLSNDRFGESVTELQDRGWVVLSESANSPLGFVRVGPTQRFFVDTDSTLCEWDPADDARNVASVVAAGDEDWVQVEKLMRQLDWKPRRMNPALYVLEAVDPDSVKTPSEQSDLAWLFVSRTPEIRRWSRSTTNR